LFAFRVNLTLLWYLVTLDHHSVAISIVRDATELWLSFSFVAATLRMSGEHRVTIIASGLDVYLKGHLCTLITPSISFFVECAIPLLQVLTEFMTQCSRWYSGVLISPAGLILGGPP
jgi:hypothetical protein